MDHLLIGQKPKPRAGISAGPGGTPSPASAPKPSGAGVGAGADDIILDGTERTFMEDVIDASRQVPVLVDFWAEWCGPCKMIAPALEEIGAEFKGKLKVAKVNIDENPGTPNNYAVRGIPTLILFKDGKPAATQVGAMPKSQLKAWVASSLSAEAQISA